MIVGATESEFPVPISVPPQELVYHLKLFPEPPVYESIVFSPLQIVCSVAETVVGCVACWFTVIVNDLQAEFPQEFSHLP